MSSVSRSTSTKTGMAPIISAALAVAMNVYGRHQDLVAGSDPDGLEGHRQGHRAVDARDAVACRLERRELLISSRFTKVPSMEPQTPERSAASRLPPPPRPKTGQPPNGPVRTGRPTMDGEGRRASSVVIVRAPFDGSAGSRASGRSRSGGLVDEQDRVRVAAECRRGAGGGRPGRRASAATAAAFCGPGTTTDRQRLARIVDIVTVSASRGTVLERGRRRRRGPAGAGSSRRSRPA